MATKNIARTAVEGGRGNYNKYERRNSNSKLRAENREYCGRIEELEDPNETPSAPRRKPVMKGFTDKLTPAYRWLRSRVGQKWAKVFKELCDKFDTRTISGRHIIYDHLLKDVEGSGVPMYIGRFGRASCDFYIDDNDILQLSDDNRWTRRAHRNRVTNPSTKQVLDWAKDRKVIDYGVSIFWMDPQEYEWHACSRAKVKYNRCHKKHKKGTTLQRVYNVERMTATEKNKLKPYLQPDATIHYYREVEIDLCLWPGKRYVQGKRFTDDDIRMWNSLYEGTKFDLLWVKPRDKNNRIIDRNKLYGLLQPYNY